MSAPPADAGLTWRLTTLGFVIIVLTAFWGALLSLLTWCGSLPG